MFLHLNCKISLLLIPPRLCPQFVAEPLHPGRDGDCITGSREPRLHVADHRGIKFEAGDPAPLGLDYKNERFVIPLDLVHRIVVHKISCAVEDRTSAIDLDAAKNMRGMTENDISALFDQGAAEPNVRSEER